MEEAVELLLEEAGLRRLEVGRGLGICACLENSADFLLEKSKKKSIFSEYEILIEKFK